MSIACDIQRALDEDIGSKDVTAQLLPPDQIIQAQIISREPMVVCGQAWVDTTFKMLDSKIKINWLVKEGTYLSTASTLCQIEGNARSILTAERTALNFLQTLSGTATTTHHYVAQLKGFHTKLLDTRKTIPGLREAQKYAVTCGGGMNHRMGLYDAFLIKENHIKSCGSIQKAIELARATKENLFIEIEVETIAQLQEALDMHPDRIMLDNFDLATIKKAVLIARPYACPLEVSGNVVENQLHAIAATGVDFISVGAITKCIKAIDLSLRVL